MIWSHCNESLPITAVRNTVERSFSKLRLIEAFHRSTVTDESLTNLARISVESETPKTFVDRNISIFGNSEKVIFLA